MPNHTSSIGAIEAQEGAGAIVSTAIDLARFAGAIAAAQLPNLPPVPGSPHVWPKDYYTISFTLPKYENPNGQWDQGHWPFGAGWDSVPGNAVEYPLVPYSDHNFIKDGGYPGTVSSVGVTADGYGFGAVFNSNYNVNGAPSPQSQIFWPGPSRRWEPLRPVGRLRPRQKTSVERRLLPAIFPALLQLDE